MGIHNRFENGIEAGGDNRIHFGVLKAKATLQKNGIPIHVHSRRCMNLLKHVLYHNEETLLEAKQHSFQSVSPVRVVATNKRLIVVYPSFWGLWTGYDLVSPTTYAILPYKYIIGVSMSRGKMLSSIKVHTSGSVDSGSQINDNGEVHGIKTGSAITMARLLEEIIEYIEESPDELSARVRNESSGHLKNNIVGLGEAKKIVSVKRSKFVWVGIEPVAYVARLLGVPKEAVLPINPTKVNSYTEEEATALDGSVIVSYDGVLSMHLSIFLKYKFGTDIYALEGGIDRIIEDARIARNFSDLYA